MGDPQKSRISKELRTAEKIDEYYHYDASSPTLCYTLFVKFFIEREEINPNFIDLVFYDKDIKARIEEYKKLFKNTKS